MKILPYKLSITNDLLTSRAGLITIAQLMQSIGFSNLVDQHFPAPRSNRGFKPSVFVNSMMLMLHEGGSCLDDLRFIRDDKALLQILGITSIPQADSMGDWLRRTGHVGVNAVAEINKPIIKLALRDCSSITLDIDATLSASKNKSAQWTYKKCTGYMPMVGHIAETSQALATEFREGNVSPNTDNLGFIHRCETALPDDVKVTKLRIDAAGYQVAIIDECIERNIQFAIRAKMNKPLKKMIENIPEAEWQPLVSKDGKEMSEEATCRLVHSMEFSKYAFTVVVQRLKLIPMKIL